MNKEKICLDILLVFAMIGQFLIGIYLLKTFNFKILHFLAYFIGLAIYSADLYMYWKIKTKIQ